MKAAGFALSKSSMMASRENMTVRTSAATKFAQGLLAGLAGPALLVHPLTEVSVPKRGASVEAAWKQTGGHLSRSMRKHERSVRTG
jgi:hypothetical protein